MSRFLTPKQFTAECDTILDEAVPMAAAMLRSGSREDVVAAVALGLLDMQPGQLASVVAVAIVRLAESVSTSDGVR